MPKKQSLPSAEAVHVSLGVQLLNFNEAEPLSSQVWAGADEAYVSLRTLMPNAELRVASRHVKPGCIRIDIRAPATVIHIWIQAFNDIKIVILRVLGTTSNRSVQSGSNSLINS